MKHISNKNGHNKVLNFAVPILLSLLIHCAFFLGLHFVFQDYKIFEKKSSENYQTITLRTFMKNTNQTIQTIQTNQTKKLNKSKKMSIRKDNDFEKKISKKVVDYSLKNNDMIEKKETFEQSEINNLENNIQEKKISGKISQNPFGYLKLPKQLLGQKLFPRKYEVLFKLTKTNTNTYDLSIARILPLQDEMAYLDKVVKNALSAQLQILSAEQKNDFFKVALAQAYEQNKTSQANDFKIETIRLVLEFHEPN